MKFYYDETFYQEAISGKIIDSAADAFSEIYGAVKRPTLLWGEKEIEALEKKATANCKILDDLTELVGAKYAEMIRACAVTYANVSDEIFFGLDDYFFNSVLMEWLLHTESITKGKRYRDHLTHQTKVTLLGLDLLSEKTETERGLFVEDVADALRTSEALLPTLKDIGISSSLIDKNIVTAAWILAGLFHDIGYCTLSFMGSSRQVQKVSKFLSGDIEEDVWQRAASLIQPGTYISEFYRRNFAWENQPSIEDIRTAIRSSCFETENHSVIGGLFLLHMWQELDTALQKAFRTSEDLRKKIRLIFEIAALAILTHDIDSPKKRKGAKFSDKFTIEFGLYPLSYLLGVADQLQDWGRRRLVRRPRQNQASTIIAIEDCGKLQIERQNSKMVCTFFPKHDPYKRIVPDYWLFNAEVVPSKPPFEFVKNYPEGRMAILNSVYGPSPLAKTFGVKVSFGGVNVGLDNFLEKQAEIVATRTQYYLE